MGPRYCEACDVMLTDYGDVEWTDCQNSNCPASCQQYCCHWADTDDPACSYCREGDSCSMCWLVGPHILKEGYDNYQSHLAPRCKNKGCPVYLLLDKEDRCLSCWSHYAEEECGVCVEFGHDREPWTIAKCGHMVCEAKQTQLKCQDDNDCAVCKEEAATAATQQAQVDERERMEKDVPMFQELLGRVQSQSAKSNLTAWLAKAQGTT